MTSPTGIQEGTQCTKCKNNWALKFSIILLYILCALLTITVAILGYKGKYSFLFPFNHHLSLYYFKHGKNPCLQHKVFHWYNSDAKLGNILSAIIVAWVSSTYGIENSNSFCLISVMIMVFSNRNGPLWVIKTFPLCWFFLFPAISPSLTFFCHVSERPYGNPRVST